MLPHTLIHLSLASCLVNLNIRFFSTSQHKIGFSINRLNFFSVWACEGFIADPLLPFISYFSITLPVITNNVSNTTADITGHKKTIHVTRGQEDSQGFSWTKKNGRRVLGKIEKKRIWFFEPFNVPENPRKLKNKKEITSHIPSRQEKKVCTILRIIFFGKRKEKNLTFHHRPTD